MVEENLPKGGRAASRKEEDKGELKRSERGGTKEGIHEQSCG